MLRGEVAPVGDQLQELVDRIYMARGRIPSAHRRDFLFVMCYLPSNLRLSVIFSLAEINPDALDDLLGSAYDVKTEPAYHNVVTTIGAFARQAMIADIFSRERIERIERLLASNDTTARHSRAEG